MEIAQGLQAPGASVKLMELNTGQVELVKRHLALVFKHEIDPSLGGNPSELQAVHDGTKPHGINYPPGVRC